jgi:hypothetical protein
MLVIPLILAKNWDYGGGSRVLALLFIAFSLLGVIIAWRFPLIGGIVLTVWVPIGSYFVITDYLNNRSDRLGPLIWWTLFQRYLSIAGIILIIGGILSIIWGVYSAKRRFKNNSVSQ